MYSLEVRKKVIELYIKYDKSAAAVSNELGYPSRKVIREWYKDYLRGQSIGDEWAKKPRKVKYSAKQMEDAVNHYLEHGRNYARTVRALGYPSAGKLRLWCDELRPNDRKMYARSIQCTQAQKKEAVVEPDTPCVRATDLGDKHSVGRKTKYKHNGVLLPKEYPIIMLKIEDKLHEGKPPEGTEALLVEIELLKKQIRILQIEKDLMGELSIILKKNPGADPKKLTNKVKATLIDALRNKYTLKELLKYIDIPKSSYHYHHQIALMSDKHEGLKLRIVELFKENRRKYGYRRIYKLLQNEGIRVSEKIVRRIMSILKLVVFGKKKRKYSSYLGEIAPAADNLIKRDFHAAAPNTKWLTDITEFAIPAGKVYLSPIVDCYDGLITSWSIGTRPDATLVNSMLDRAIDTLQVNERPIVHSDRGCHYRWPGWLSRMDNAGLVRSMSKKGCSPDNSACEGFFGRLKVEMFYYRSWVGVSLNEFMNILDDYIIWYNEKRIKMSLGGMSPLVFRRSKGLVA